MRPQVRIRLAEARHREMRFLDSNLVDTSMPTVKRQPVQTLVFCHQVWPISKEYTPRSILFDKFTPLRHSGPHGVKPATPGAALAT